MVGVADVNATVRFLFLEMAFKTERGVTFRQQALVNRPVWRVARDAAFANGLVLVNKRAALFGVTLQTGVIHTEQSQAASLECLWQARPAALDGATLVGVVAVHTTHLAFEDRVVMRELEFGPDLQVALETRFR